jgi:hypothetical protein
MSEGFRKMDHHEIQEMNDKVQFAADPIPYLAGMIDDLATHEDELSEVDIAIELLEAIDTNLQLIAEDRSIVSCAEIETLLTVGRGSPEGYRIIFSMFKEIGFSLETMLSAVELTSNSPTAQLNNLSVLRTLRQVYATE